MSSIRRTSFRFALVVAAAAILAFAAGCQKRPFEAKIDARNDFSFSAWVGDHTGDLTADEQRQLNDALQQIKLAVMTDSPGLAADDFTRTVYADIYGHTVREVLLRGIDAQASRLSADIASLEEREEKYRKVDATALSPQAREFLEGFNARMAQRRAELQRFDERRALVRAHP